jgi:hypothetical protein
MSVFTDSLSFGMREAIDQGCQDELIILTACKFSNEAELEEILERYTKVYWKKHPTAADATRRAYGEGRIIVPRLEGFLCPIGTPGEPLYVDWQEWRWEVSRHAPQWCMGWCPHHCEVTESQVLACNSVMEVCKLFPKVEW